MYQMCQLPLFFTGIPRQHHVFVALAGDFIHTLILKKDWMKLPIVLEP